MTATIHHGDCLDVLRAMPDNSVHAIVTDPPYGLSNTTPEQVADTIVKWVSGERDYLPTSRGFMGKSWDGFVPPVAVWDEAMRVLKPGGHVLAFAGTRTMDLMTLGLRLAGADIRDSVYWHYGSGMPKSHNLKGEWSGWGTALKPATEPIVLARKPFPGKTVAANVLEHGTGGLNIDACRVPPLTDAEVARSGKSTNGGIYGEFQSVDWKREGKPHPGRWPANVILDEHMAGVLDEQSGSVGAHGTGKNPVTYAPESPLHGGGMKWTAPFDHGDKGGASRFFYVAKASKRERPDVDGIKHPTVKPLALMRWLVRLVTPPDGIVLDPFAGSGTTIEAAMLEGFNVIGIEREAEYLPLIQHRIDRAQTAQTEAPEQGAFAFKEHA